MKTNDDAGYVFSVSDFDTSRSLSDTKDEPAIAGQIRFLKRRVEELMPGEADVEFYQLCGQWWDDLIDEECSKLRENRWSPHAQFDLEAGGDEGLEEEEDREGQYFPSDTGIVMLDLWLSDVLNSGDPNPKEHRRTKQDDGSRLRTTARLHEMLAAIAHGDLYKATMLLVKDPHTNATQIAELLLSASECVNRSEMHLWAASHLAGARKSMTSHRKRRVAVGMQIARAEPLKPHQARVTQHAGSLSFEYGGEHVRIDRVTMRGGLTHGFSILLDLLARPNWDLSILTLYKSFRHQAPVSVGGEWASAVSVKEAEEAGLNATGERESIAPENDPLFKLLKRAQAARERGDHEEADRLAAEAEGSYAGGATRSPNQTQENRTRPRLQSPETRASIRNAGKRLDDAVRRLEKEFPALGKHLRAGIKETKSETVRYDPQPCVEWLLEKVE